MDIATLQSLAMPIGIMIVGILLLLKGGDWTINSSVFIAKRFGLSPMVVGFTILAFGTSLPELIVSILAVLQGSEGIAMGNVIGSNLANILCVIGFTALFVTFKVTITKALIKDLTMMLVCSLLLAGLMIFGDISRIAGGAMLTILAVYVFIQYRMASKGERTVDEIDDEDLAFSSPLISYAFLGLGLLFVAGGAEFLVRGAKESALIIGVPEAVIALSIIAFGTSLPELSTSIIAGRKGHTDMVLGNIIGSNVFNVLMIIGITALVKPIASTSYAPQLLNFDIWLMIGVSLLFAALLLIYKKINTAIGIAFMGGYIAYNIYIYAIYFGS
jgi:cation:H+ antiporter